MRILAQVFSSIAPRAKLAMAGAAVAIAVGVAAPATASGPFTGLIGTWNGTGEVKLDGGRTETLKCTAYYTDRGGGNALGIALRCANASSKIEMRANLTNSGGRISGSWEERQYNAVGNLAGLSTGNKLTLSITGGGLSGSMSVTTNGTSQVVQITTEGSTLKGVSIGLNKT